MAPIILEAVGFSLLAGKERRLLRYDNIEMVILGDPNFYSGRCNWNIMAN